MDKKEQQQQKVIEIYQNARADGKINDPLVKQLRERIRWNEAIITYMQQNRPCANAQDDMTRESFNSAIDTVKDRYSHHGTIRDSEARDAIDYLTSVAEKVLISEPATSKHIRNILSEVILPLAAASGSIAAGERDVEKLKRMVD